MPVAITYGTLAPDVGYSEERKAEILKAYHERSSLRGLERTFGVARQTVAAWLKKAQHLQPLENTLVPACPGDVLKLDERWSFVQCKASACWVWVALCRRTRQVVSWFAGDRSADSCRQLWEGIPEAYRTAHTYSGF